MSLVYSIEELVSLFNPSDPPENINDFGPFSCQECKLPISLQKPFNQDLPPYTREKREPRIKNTPKLNSKPVPKNPVVPKSTVEVSNEFKDTNFSWVKKPQKEEKKIETKKTQESFINATPPTPIIHEKPTMKTGSNDGWAPSPINQKKNNDLPLTNEFPSLGINNSIKSEPPIQTNTTNDKDFPSLISNKPKINKKPSPWSQIK